MSLEAAIARNYRHFLSKVRAMEAASDRDHRILLAAQASIFAVNNPCGILYSHEIESDLRAVADTLPTPPDPGVTPNTFLHVFSRADVRGGHTRIAERWIHASPAGQRHDVVLINQGNRPVPARLDEVTAEKAGRVMRLREGQASARATELRALAMGYLGIILHVHMYDTVPLLAFGAANFTRPILFYNHADHLFWLGASLADIVVNFRSSTRLLNQQARRLDSHEVLPLPMQEIAPVVTTAEERQLIRQQLGFRADQQIIVTVAAPYKYTPFHGIDFLAATERILAEHPQAVLLAIGPSMRNAAWRNAARRSQGRIRPIGPVPAAELDRYLQIADLGLESFPLGSPTALMEMARHGIPCVGLRSATNQIDLLDEAGIACADVPAIIDRVGALLRNKTHDNNFLDLLKRDALPDGFGQKLRALVDAIPAHHQIRPILTREPHHLSEIERLVAINHFARANKLMERGKRLARAVIYGYARYFYPHFMSDRAYGFMNSKGLL